MSDSEFLSQANVTCAALAAGNGRAHSAKSKGTKIKYKWWVLRPAMNSPRHARSLSLSKAVEAKSESFNLWTFERWTLYLCIDWDKRPGWDQKRLWILFRNDKSRNKTTPPLRYIKHRARCTQHEVLPRRRVSASRDDGCSRSAALLPFLPPGLRIGALRPTLSGGMPLRALFIRRFRRLTQIKYQIHPQITQINIIKIKK
jgi:hypothetical protein